MGGQNSKEEPQTHFTMTELDRLSGRISGGSQDSAMVLWVDDDNGMRAIGKRFMDSLGHAADFASSGEEAIEFLKKNPYKILITDIGMPGMDGWQLVESIKGLYPGMKIVVCTGQGVNIPAEKKDRHNVDHIIGKPVYFMEIKKLTEELLHHKS